MAVFNFRLQSILNLKIQLEKSQKNELGRVVSKLEYESGILDNLKNERKKQIKKIDSMIKKPVTVADLKINKGYIAYLKSRLDNQEEIVKKASKNADIEREKLIEIVKERKILEKHRQKELDKFKTEQRKLEQKLNDESLNFKQNRR